MIRSVEVTGSGSVLSHRGEYSGFSLRENSDGAAGAVPAIVRIRDGSATGPIIDVIALPIGESKTEHYGTEGITVQNGIYVQVAAGTVEGCIRSSSW